MVETITPNLAPAAPAKDPIPLPGISPPIVPASRETNVSYPSVAESEKEVFYRKYGRYKWWARDAAEQGAVGILESRPGRAVGVGSAIWSDTNTLSREDIPISLGHTSNGLRRSASQLGPVTSAKDMEVQQRAHRSQVGNSLTALPTDPTLPRAPQLRVPSATKPSPLPVLARPQKHLSPISNKATSPAPGDLLQPVPSQGSTRAQREAYLSSALSLPLDMLVEVVDPLPPQNGSRSSSKGKTSRESAMPPDGKPSQSSARLPLRSLSATLKSPASAGSTSKGRIKHSAEVDKPFLARSKTVAISTPNQAMPNVSLPRPHLLRSTKTAHPNAPPAPPLSQQTPRPVFVQPLGLPSQGKIPPNGALGLTDIPDPSIRHSWEPSKAVEPQSVPLATVRPERQLGSQGSKRRTRPSILEAPSGQSSGHTFQYAERSLPSTGAQQARHQESTMAAPGQSLGSHQSGPLDHSTKTMPASATTSTLLDRRPPIPTLAAPVAQYEPPTSETTGKLSRNAGRVGSANSRPSQDCISSTLSPPSLLTPRGVDTPGPVIVGSNDAIKRNLDSRGVNRSPSNSESRLGVSTRQNEAAVRSAGSTGSQWHRPSPLNLIEETDVSRTPAVTENVAIQVEIARSRGGQHVSSQSSMLPLAPAPTPAEMPLRSISTTGSRDPVTVPPNHAPALPIAHRQQLPLPRPALSRTHSSSQGLLTLGRRQRDSSTTSLTARFEPAMYPLPPSGPSGTKTDTVVLSPVSHTPSALIPAVRSTGTNGTANSPSVNLAGNTVVYATNSNVHIATPDAPPLPPKQSRLRTRGPLAARVEEISDDEMPYATTVPPPSRPVYRVSETMTGPHTVPREVQPPVQGLAQSISDRGISVDGQTVILPSSPPVNIQSPDADHLSFEVPSGNRGRLRVSLAWFRDGPRSDRRRRRDHQADHPSSPSPPPVPPKGPALISTRIRETFSPRRGDRNPPHTTPRPEVTRDVDRGHRPDLSTHRQSPPKLFSPPRLHSPEPVTPFYPQGMPTYGRQPYPMPHSGMNGFAYPQPPPGVIHGMLSPWPRPEMGIMMGPHGMPLMHDHFGHSAQHSQSHLNLSRTAPPSPPRPPSIEPPSSRGSPPAAPAPLPGQGYGNAMLGMNQPVTPVARSQPEAQQHHAMQRPIWARQSEEQRPRYNGGGMISRMFGKKRNVAWDDDQPQDTSRIGMWRRNVVAGRAPTIAPTVAPTYAPLPATYPTQTINFGRTDDRWGQLFPRRRRRADEEYYSQGQRLRTRPADFMSTGIGLGFTRVKNGDGYGNFGRAARTGNGLHADLRRSERARLKEIRRREKVIRRNRREARSKESLSQSQNQSQPRLIGIAEPRPTPRNQGFRLGGLGGFNLFNFVRHGQDGSKGGFRGQNRSRPIDKGESARRGLAVSRVPVMGMMEGLFGGRRDVYVHDVQPEGGKRKLSARKWGDRARQRRRV